MLRAIDSSTSLVAAGTMEGTGTQGLQSVMHPTAALSLQSQGRGRRIAMGVDQGALTGQRLLSIAHITRLS